MDLIFASLKKLTNMDLIFCKLKKAQKTWNSIFCKLKKAQKTTALIQHFNPEKPNVFELGTNIGVVFVPTAIFLQSRGGEMVGVDASPENFALATVNRELNGLTNTIIVNRAILNNTAENSVVNILVNQGNRNAILTKKFQNKNVEIKSQTCVHFGPFYMLKHFFPKALKISTPN